MLRGVCLVCLCFGQSASPLVELKTFSFPSLSKNKPLLLFHCPAARTATPDPGRAPVHPWPPPRGEARKREKLFIFPLRSVGFNLPARLEWLASSTFASQWRTPKTITCSLNAALPALHGTGVSTPGSSPLASASLPLCSLQISDRVNINYNRPQRAPASSLQGYMRVKATISSPLLFIIH